MLYIGARSKNQLGRQPPRPAKVDTSARDQRKQSSSSAATAVAQPNNNNNYKQHAAHTTYLNFAQNVILALPPKEENALVELKDVLSAVWQCQEITDVCPDLVIRLTSLRGEVCFFPLSFSICAFVS
jgi:hypothetical protein